MPQIKIFVSYSHEDELYFDLLLKGIKKHSKSLNFNWDVWEDTKLPIGEEWHDFIQEKVACCDVAMLMISANFFNSDYINQYELENFLRRKSTKNDIIIFPILIDPCFFDKASLISDINIFRAKGSRYDRPNIDDFTYADLVRMTSDGGILPNPMRERYHMDVVRTLNKSIETGSFSGTPDN
jgi:hypothetical protein